MSIRVNDIAYIYSLRHNIDGDNGIKRGTILLHRSATERIFDKFYDLSHPRHVVLMNNHTGKFVLLDFHAINPFMYDILFYFGWDDTPDNPSTFVFRGKEVFNHVQYEGDLNEIKI